MQRSTFAGARSRRIRSILTACSLAGAAAFAGNARADALNVLFIGPPELDGKHYWRQFFGSGSHANDDLIVTNQLPDATAVHFRQNHDAHSLSVLTDRKLVFKPNLFDNPQGLLINGGSLSAAGGSLLNFQVTLAFNGQAEIHSSGPGSGMIFDELLLATGDISISGEIEVDSVSPNTTYTFGLSQPVDGVAIAAPSMTVKSSYVSMGPLGTTSLPLLTIGDGVGDRFRTSALPGTYTDSAYLSLKRTLDQTDVVVKADGTLDTSEMSRFKSLTLEGGLIETSGTGTINTLRAPSLIRATPGQLPGGQLQPSLISSLAGSGPGSVDLQNTQVEFRAESAFGATLALEVESAITNGSLLKTGNGIMLLSGTTSNTHSQTTIRQGGLMLSKTNGATAIPGNVTVGDLALPSSASLIHGASNQIADTGIITLQAGAQWNLNNHTETVAGVVLIGSQVTGTGTMTLLSDGSGGVVTALRMNGMPTPSISPSINLNGQSSTIAAGPGLGVSSGLDLILSGSIGNGTLNLDGPGTIRLTGSSNNTVAGTVITDGTVELAKTGGTNAVGNDLLVGTTGSSTGPTVRWLESFQIPTSIPVRFRSGVLDLNDKVASFGGLNASGGGSMNIVTGAGTMGVQGNMISFEGARVDFNGNIDLTGASRNFSARGSALLQPNFTNWTITGTISNGTVRKTGIGRIEMNNVAGDAVIDIAEGTVRATNSTFGGLQGTGEFNVLGTVVVNDPAGSQTFSGALTGSGSLTKSGPGVLTLAGGTANTITGPIIVSNGELKLEKTAGAPAIPATLRTQANSIITALADSQFASNAAVVMNGGSLALGTTSQSLGMLQALNGTITGSDSGGLLAASQPSGFLNSTLDNLNVNFGAETELANTHADIRGLATASVTFQSGSVLEVRNRSFGGASEMQFSKDLLMRNGTTFLLNVGSPGDVALIDIDGGLLIGTLTGGGAEPFTMSGQVQINLGTDTTLPNGIYDLIDFSNAPYAGTTAGGFSGSAYPTLDNFTLASQPMEGFWQLQVNSNVLQLVSVVPEPSTVMAIAMSAAGLLRRRTRRRI